MDSSNRTSHDLALDELVALALNELERVGYGADSCRHYRTTWCRLVAFARDNGLGDRYSEELADRFVHGTGSRDRERVGPSDKALRHAVLAVKVLGDFNRDRRIEPFLTDMLKVALAPTMKKPLRDYEEYCQEHRRLRPNTIAAHIRQVAKFLLFLDSRGVRRVQEMQPDVVTAFVVSRQHLRPRAVAWIVLSLRLFLKFLAMRGTLGEDLSRVLPRVLAAPDAAIPAVWDPELVVKPLTDCRP